MGETRNRMPTVAQALMPAASARSVAQAFRPAKRAWAVSRPGVLRYFHHGLLWATICVLTGTIAAQQGGAQAPENQPAMNVSTPAAAQSAQPSTPAAPPETYSYNPEGRRDPFFSLLSRGSDLRSTGKRPEGRTGLAVTEIVLKGIVKNQGNYVAIVQSPDNKTYTLRPNDRLFDGTVKTVTADALVLMQEVNDPLSLEKQREVRKPLRPVEEVK